HSARQLSPSSDVRDLARRLANAAPSAQPKDATVQTDRVPERTEAHLKSTGPISENAPTLRQSELAVAEFKDNVIRLRAIRTAVIEAATETIASVLSDGHKPLVKEFIDELAGSLSRGALNRVVPSIDTPDAAKAWVRTNLMPTATGEGALTEAKWVWDGANFEPRVARITPHFIPVTPRMMPGMMPGMTPGMMPGPGNPLGGYATRPPVMPNFPTTSARPTTSFRIRR